VAVFAYSPSVWCYIKSTAQNQIFDVSGDMVRGQTVLRSNAPHQMSVTLMNKNRRYDALFSPNDLFVIYMKRTRRLMIMSGYLDSVPWYSTWERSVQIFGTCTMKRLLQKRWDPGTIAALNLMSNYGNTAQQLASDGGMAQKAIALITQVGGWPEDTIHIAGLPTSWAQKIANLYNAANPILLGNVMGNVGAAVSTSGPNSPVVGSTPNAQNLPPAVTPTEQVYFSLPDPTQGLAAVPYSGPMDIHPNYQGKYFCQLNWGYMAPGGQPVRKIMRDWLAAPVSKGSGPVMVYSPVTGKTVLCAPVGQGPGKYNATKPKIGLSPAALSTLGITTAMMKQGSGALVYVAWCDQSVKGNNYPPGPWPVVTVTKKVNGKLVTTTTKAQVQNNTGGSGDGSGNDPFPPSTQQSTTQAAAVVKFAEAQVNKSNYCLGTQGQVQQGSPIGYAPTFDCSGLCWAAWNAAGLQWPRSSSEAYWTDPNIEHISDASQLLPGDLVFYYNPGDTSEASPNHMGIYVGDNIPGYGSTQMTVQDHDTTQGTTYTALTYGLAIVGFGRPTGYPGFQKTPSTAVAGSASAGSPSSSSTSAGITSAGFASGSGLTPQTQTNTSFVNYWEWFGQAPTAESNILTGIRGLLNDQPLLPFINTVMNCSMRSWCSAPNGDFIAWFPDYFGAYGQAASIKVADVELMDFSIAWSDQNLVTHQYVASSWVGQVFGASPAGAPNLANMATTDGVVTLEMGSVSNNILQTVLNLPAGDASNLGSPQAILNRFGARPNFQEIGVIMGPQAQFWYALFLFQLNWASMWTANVPTTFMPEAFPGMLIQLSDGFQAYISQVVHAWDYTDGGPGFTTQMAIMAPSDWKNGGLFGLPNGGTTAVV
jgi:cell wall-associated NlpC family hydrolase